MTTIDLIDVFCRQSIIGIHPIDVFLTIGAQLCPIPLKVPELCMDACFCLIPNPHTELTRSETPRQLNQRRVRLHVN